MTSWRAFASWLELGRGAFARVYLAEEVNLGRRPVAIKVSRPDGDEPQILARLQHTHIVPVHSVCDDPEYRPARLVHAVFRWGESRAGSRGIRGPHPHSPQRSKPGRSTRPGQPKLHIADRIGRFPGRDQPAGSERRNRSRPHQPAPLLQLVGPAPGEPGCVTIAITLFAMGRPAHGPYADCSRARRRPRSAVAPVSARCLGDSGRGLDRGPAGRRPRACPFARIAPPRSEALEYSAGRRRDADAARLQSVRRSRCRKPPRPRSAAPSWAARFLTCLPSISTHSIPAARLLPRPSTSDRTFTRSG